MINKNMNTKLTFKEWKKIQNVSISLEAVNGLKIHGLDAEKEADFLLQSLYNNYLQEDKDMT